VGCGHQRAGPSMSGDGSWSGNEEEHLEGSDCDDSHCEPVRWSAEELRELLHLHQEYEKRLDPVTPSTLAALRVSGAEDLTGKTFESRASFALTVAGRNEAMRRLVTVKKSTSRILRYVCVSDGCDYYVVASLRFDRHSGQFTTWTVGAFRGHTCTELQSVSGRKRTNYSASQLVPAFQHLIEDRNSISRKALSTLVQNYVAWPPSPMFVQRIVDKCVEARFGSDGSCECNIARQLGALEALGNRTFHETETLVKFRERLLTIDRGGSAAAGGAGGDATDRNAVDVKLKHYKQGDEILLYLGFAPSNLAQGDTLSTYVPVIALDAAHMKNREGGNIFNAVIRDANGETQLLFFMVTILNESEETWTKFLEFGYSVYGDKLDNAQTVFVTDGDKGGRKAVGKIWKNIAPFMCSRHLAQVVRKKRAADAGHFLRAVHARTRREVHECIDEMIDVNQKKLRGVLRPSDADEGAMPEYNVVDLCPENWSLIFSGANRGVATSNWVEGIHGTMLSSRRLNMIACFLDVIHAEFKRYNTHRRTAQSLEHGFPPNVAKELRDLKAQDRDYQVTSLGDGRYEVYSHLSNSLHEVDLNLGAAGDGLATCSCPLGALKSQFWEPHILAAAEEYGDRDRALDDRFSLATYKKQYATVQRRPTTDEVEEREGNEVMKLPPPAILRRRGRPKNQSRFRSALERSQDTPPGRKRSRAESAQGGSAAALSAAGGAAAGGRRGHAVGGSAAAGGAGGDATDRNAPEQPAAAAAAEQGAAAAPSAAGGAAAGGRRGHAGRVRRGRGGWRGRARAGGV